MSVLTKGGSMSVLTEGGVCVYSHLRTASFYSFKK